MRKRGCLLSVVVVCAALLTPSFAMDEQQWLLEVSALEPAERRDRLQAALKTYARDNCGLLLGALLSGDEEIELVLPAIHRHVRLLVRAEDVEYLADKLKGAEDAQRQDWLTDLLGFCGEPGFAELRKLRAGSADQRVRIGALRAMGNLLIPKALEEVTRATSQATDVAEREAGRCAEARLRWRTGQWSTEPRPQSSVPRVALEDGIERIRAALARGGTLVVGAGELAKGSPGFLKALKVNVPFDLTKGAPEHCTFSLPDFHRLLAYPFDFFCLDVAARAFADHSWGKWHPGQSATLRLQNRPKRATVIIQEGVLGKGRVIFSGISVHSVSSMARLGIADRDPWDENLGWFHANRETASHLYVWQARRGFVSQHVPWGKPLKGGTVRAAVVTPSFNARDVIEFDQRIEMEYEHLPYTWAKQRGFAHGVEEGRLTPPCFEILERVLAEPRDVVILSGRSLPGKASTETWSALPAGYQESLLQVCREKGTGIVVIGERGPLPRVPSGDVQKIDSPAGAIWRAEWGKGRLVSLGRPGRFLGEFVTPGAFRKVTRLNPYDYWGADVAAQIAWAARRGPLLGVGPPAVREGSVSVQVSNQHEERFEGTLQVAFRDPAARVAATGTTEFALAAGQEEQVTVEVKGLSAGRFVAEIVARDKAGASLGWRWCPVHIKGVAEVRDLKFDRPMYRPGEEMAFELVTKGGLPPETRAETRVTDRYGRLCGQSDAPVDPAAPVCRVRVGRPLWRYVYVRVSLRKGDRLLTQFEKPWIVDVPPPEKDFPYGAWSDVTRQASLAPMVHLAGIDWLNRDFEMCLHNGVRPWIIGFGGLGLGHHAPAMNYQRNPCTMGPTFHQWRLNEIPPRMPDIIRAGVPAIIDQDEESLGGEYGFHPASLHQFRKHLRVVHGSLERLNKVWQTSYKEWSEVMPLRHSQVKGRESLAPMVELRMFMDTAYLHHVKFDRFVAESCGLPDVKLGLSTSGGGFADGWDLWKASKMLTCMIRQHTGNRETFRCWRRPDMVLGRWTGGYYPDCVTSGHFMPWHQLLHESTAYNTWGAGAGTDMSIWRGDATPRDGIAVAAKELQEIWTGPATLIRHSTRVPPQIGLHYSRASQMTSVVDWPGASVWGAASTVEHALEVMGHQYRWISYEELEQGFCDTWPGKCLFLPLSTCLSAHEAAGVRRYVANGGTVVADCDPGTRDRYGGAPGAGQLADVFGCEWAPAPPVPKGASAKVTLNVKGLPNEIELKHRFHRIAKATSGKPRGVVRYGGKEHPAWIVHPFGKGKAITLNFLPGKTNVAAEVIKALLTAAGVTFEVGVLKDGAEMELVERFSFRDGPTRYTGVINFVKMRRHWGPLELSPDEQKPVQGVTVRFPVKSHLYDVRTKKHHGQTDRLVMDVAPGRAYLFAHLAYPVRGVEIGLPDQTSVKGTGRIRMKVVADGGDLGPHALRVQISDPRGREREEYGVVRYCPKGVGQVGVPFAPNDPTGAWRVVVTDASTGLSAERTWEVQP